MVCELDGPGPTLNKSKTEVVIGEAIMLLTVSIRNAKVYNPVRIHPLLLWLPLGWLLLNCQSAADVVHTGPKFKGVNLVAPPRNPGLTGLDGVKTVGGEWVAVVPYGFTRKGEAHFFSFWNRPPERRATPPAGGSPAGGSPAGGQWWGETPAGVAETVQMARQQGLKVMFKPHVWMMGGSHLDLEFSTEADWQSFEADYSRYILGFAHLADSLHVDAYCITTELDRFAVARPDYWKKLIAEVRAIYKGPLTYAANWDRYEKIPFWSQLDYIGVDAYFPLSDDRQPDVSALVRGWKPHLKALRRFSQQQQKPILFTEFGYRSCDYTGQRPWESETDCTPNAQAQANAFSALFEGVWPQSWFAGGFVWKWFMAESHGHHERDQYSPQGKLAGDVLTKNWHTGIATHAPSNGSIR